jgi:hypothetical protein
MSSTTKCYGRVWASALTLSTTWTEKNINNVRSDFLSHNILSETRMSSGSEAQIPTAFGQMRSSGAEIFSGDSLTATVSILRRPDPPLHKGTEGVCADPRLEAMS